MTWRLELARTHREEEGVETPQSTQRSTAQHGTTRHGTAQHDTASCPQEMRPEGPAMRESMETAQQRTFCSSTALLPPKPTPPGCEYHSTPGTSVAPFSCTQAISIYGTRLLCPAVGTWSSITAEDRNLNPVFSKECNWEKQLN